jgi:hypothetical protein
LLKDNPLKIKIYFPRIHSFKSSRSVGDEIVERDNILLLQEVK